MFDYSILSSKEFEELCKDILQKDLGQPLRTYAPGRDQGIDATGYQPVGGTGSIVMQAKRYIDSDIEKLLRDIKKEKNKIDKLNPDSYYICCSKTLPYQKVEEIFHHYKQYMTSLENVYDKNRLDVFLKQPQNRDVLNIHFKLWLQSTNVLAEMLNRHVTVDSEVYIKDVAGIAPYFVSTRWYQEGIAALEYNKVILITGAPGVGKSTLTKMLALYCISNGFQLRNVSGNNPDSIKAAIGVDKGTKELIIMDDFLGQRYEDVLQVKDGSLLTLIQYVALCENKILLMNTRIAVYCYANEQFEKLERYLNTAHIHEIRVEGLSAEEKARILYNHLKRNEELYQIPHEYYESIAADKAYEKIISHKNYNPRIIDMATEYHRVDRIKADKFVASILERLEHPEDVWRNEFFHIGQEDRVLLFTLFSLTQTTVDDNRLKECFWSRIKYSPLPDTTSINYERILDRLMGTFLSYTREHNRYTVGFSNPSIVDYMAMIFSKNESERDNLLHSALYYEQLFACCQKNPDQLLLILGKIAEHDDIFRYKSLSYNNDWNSVITVVLGKFKICQERYKEFLNDWVQESDTEINKTYVGKYTYGDIAVMLFQEPMYSYYGFDRYLSDEDTYLSLIRFASLADIIRITDHILPMVKDDVRDEWVAIIGDQISDMIYKHILYFDVDSYCQDRFGLNDYHDELGRLSQNVKQQPANNERYEDLFLDEDEEEDCYDTNDEPSFTSELLGKALYNMAVNELREELQAYINSISHMELKQHLLPLPDPEEELSEDSFYENTNGMFELASHFMTYSTIKRETQKQDYLEEKDRVDRLFQDDFKNSDDAIE